MRRFLFAVLCMLQAATSQTRHRLPSGLHEPVTRGFDLVLRQEYDAADSTFRALAVQFPSHPSGPLFRAAVLQARSLDLGVPLDRSLFDSLLDAGRERCVRLREQVDIAPWPEFFEATANGYEAVARVEAGDWFGGIRKGMASASAFERVIADDSTFADAYTGLGAYRYWRSRKTEFLQWLPFVTDDRAEGIAMLERGYFEGEYDRYAAVSSLVAIFLDAGDYTSAETWARVGLRSYPRNRVFRWGTATALHRQGRLAEAIPEYDTLLTMIRLAASANPYDEVVCRLNLVRCRIASADTTGVRSHLDAILVHERTEFPGSFADRVVDKLDEARHLRLQYVPPSR